MAQINERFLAQTVCHSCRKRQAPGQHFLMVPSQAGWAPLEVCWPCVRDALNSYSGIARAFVACDLCDKPTGDHKYMLLLHDNPERSNFHVAERFICKTCAEELRVPVPRTPEEALICIHSSRRIIKETAHTLLGGTP